jgi:hypothetical protein
MFAIVKEFKSLVIIEEQTEYLLPITDLLNLYLTGMLKNESYEDMVEDIHTLFEDDETISYLLPNVEEFIKLSLKLLAVVYEELSEVIRGIKQLQLDATQKSLSAFRLASMGKLNVIKSRRLSELTFTFYFGYENNDKYLSSLIDKLEINKKREVKKPHIHQVGDSVGLFIPLHTTT